MKRRVVAPAKVNVGLRILGRRADGMHLLDSLFVPIDFADGVEVSVSRSHALRVSCHCLGREDLDGEQNLAARAGRAFLEAAGIAAAVEIVIDKRIWTGAGLGGGSSDAAAVLSALHAWNWAAALGTSSDVVDDAMLQRLALNLGADVPFFLRRGPQRARGIGDDLGAVTGLPEIGVVLVNPNVSLATADVYRGLRLRPGEMREGIAPLPNDLRGDFDLLCELVRNDLEPAALALCPQVSKAKQLLCDAGAPAVSMSGSGSTVFALLQSHDAARALAGEVAGKTPFSVRYCAVFA